MLFQPPGKNAFGHEHLARPAGTSDQIIVYNMHLTAADGLAMMFPIPSDRKKGESAVSFINLSKFPKFFTALREGSPPDADFVVWGVRDSEDMGVAWA